MVDNDERKAVAALLRAFSDNGLWSEFSDYCNAAGPARLADLIDPVDVIPGETCEIEGDGTPDGEPLPPIVDREALLAVAKELERVPDPLCCECPLLEGYDDTQPVTHWLRRFALRIREACGEQAS